MCNKVVVFRRVSVHNTQTQSLCVVVVKSCCDAFDFQKTDLKLGFTSFSLSFSLLSLSFLFCFCFLSRVRVFSKHTHKHTRIQLLDYSVIHLVLIDQHWFQTAQIHAKAPLLFLRSWFLLLPRVKQSKLIRNLTQQCHRLLHRTIPTRRLLLRNRLRCINQQLLFRLLRLRSTYGKLVNQL